MNWFKQFCYFALFIAFIHPVSSFSQRYDTVSVFSLPVQLDSFVVRSGFDVNAFIRRVKTDTTFYKAFKNMRFLNYSAVNKIAVYDKHDHVSASLDSKTTQVYERNCRSTKTTEEHTTGDFYKRNGDYNYYTAGLYAYLFFAKVPVCNESDLVAGSLEARGKGQMERSKYELKQLIFNPGSKVNGIPFMGDRESIFDQGEAEKYDFRIQQESYAGIDCYIFRIIPKGGYEHKVIYNELTTWFRKEDYSIVARDYSLSYKTLVYDFDVHMKVRTTQIGNKLYPTSIEYDGNWHILTKKRERVKFKIEISY